MHAAYMQYFHCLTPLHNGAGQGLGSIDRPVIRERTTGYPFVQSSTIKGVYAARARSTSAEKQWVDWAFGVGESAGNQGCLLFADASLLAFPVRSMIGSFVWTTSPLALARYARTAAFASDPGGVGMKISDLLKDLVPLAQGEALGTSTTAGGGDWDRAISYQQRYYLESLVLTSRSEPGPRGKLAAVADALAELVFDEVYWKTFFRGRFVLVSDDDFEFLVQHATLVEANIRIEESGVTKDGSLRYTEFVPAETILSSLVVVELPMDRDAKLSRSADADTVVRSLEGLVKAERGTVQLGADETKGKGLTRTTLHSGQRLLR